MGTMYVSVKGLTKDYAKLRALDDVNLDLSSGRIIGLLGKNGAGKSTLLKCILGLIRYRGEINILGRNSKDWGSELFRRVAFIPDVSGLDPRLTVQETIAYASRINPRWDAEKSERLFSESELNLSQRVGTLSKGMKTKLYLLLTLSRDADILFLDEPTLGLDIVFRKTFYDMLLGEFFDESKTVFVSTHQVSELENILDEVVFIDKGRILQHSNVSALKQQWKRVQVPASREEELRNLNAKQIVRGLGKAQGLVEGEIFPEGADIEIPSLTEIFMLLLNERGEAV